MKTKLRRDENTNVSTGRTDGAAQPSFLAHQRRASFSASTTRQPRTATNRTRLPVLRNDLGFWELNFDAQQATVKCEPGAYYVAALLARPNDQSLSGLEVAASASHGNCPCLDKAAVPKPGAAGALTSWLRRIEELEIILESSAESEPVKAEITRELEAMYAWNPRQAAPESQPCEADRLVWAAILRFQQNLALASDVRGQPHLLLRRFAAHLKQFLLDPSAACSPGLVYRPPN